MTTETVTCAKIDEWFGKGGLKLSEIRTKAKKLGLKVTNQSTKIAIKKQMEGLIQESPPKIVASPPVTERHTLPIFTKYEIAKILAERAREIAAGQPITIKDPGTTNPKEIAMMEFKAGKSPKKVKRTWPDGTTEVWNVSELHSLF